ncbi:PepSY-associated TM helix domain-containing protein [Novosphingobium sp. BL-8H]|uniref:PepSY-associated TM helix domain-containing protein n=1 Tax=Novosphingobium sp. BL-8H TaxID=3127640 RepID=UPI0037563BD0
MKVLDTLHRWTGGLIGLVLAMLGCTGLLLIHEDLWIRLPHAGDAQVQETGALADATQRIMADATRRPQSILYASADFGLDRLSYGGGSNGGGAYVTQSGAPVVTWNSAWQRPEIWMVNLHRRLLADEAGETVIGIAGLCGVFFVVSGAFLWWRTRKTYEFRLWPARMSRPAIVRHHRDLGIVVAPLLLLSFVTGSVLVFRPLSVVLFGPGAPKEITQSLAAPEAAQAPVGRNLDWAGMVRQARTRFPDAELRTLSLPRKNSGVITLRLRNPGEWLPNGRTTVWFAADTGQMIGARDAADLPRAVRGYSMLFPLHAAKVGGLPYRLVMSISGLALALLGTFAVWTFWFKRPKPKRR